eukprot:CAMPEP_0172872092 /NCGR_PEP_ID=MMETSP1075-20121228/92448_1 /TAXON_ID=2916 /ORGANISM="Ceratium fusus, Strain PA161109" /LENGTH=130 /DNA_ID=CAMNT_0013722399 /DNA_START=192 /DNA_END=584 /DNA_ORIENTATION=-
MLLAVDKVAFVLLAVRPVHCTPRAHAVPHPLPPILSAVAPPISTFSVHIVGIKAALVGASSLPRELALPALVTRTELTLEARAVSKAFNTVSVLQLVAPLTLVGRPIAVGVLATSMFPVSLKRAFITGAV